MEPVSYDAESDVLYVRLNAGKSARQTRSGDLRIIDIAEDGAVLGIEFVCASGGVDLRDIPFSQTVERLILDSGLSIKLFA